MKRSSSKLSAIVVADILSLTVIPLVHAADNDQPRLYMSIRSGAVVKSTHEVAPGYQGTLGGEDVVGLCAGMNFTNMSVPKSVSNNSRLGLPRVASPLT